MIDAGQVLADLQRLLKVLENDLRQRCQDQAGVNARVQAEYSKAKNAGRTSQAYEVWRDEFITQVAVAWILACVFVRFIEDNRMLDEAGAARVWLAGPAERLRLARDHHTLYFRQHPTESDREYLEHVFRTAANPTGKRPISVVRALLDEEYNPLWRLGVSGDGATALLNFWQRVDPETGSLRHDFTDAEWNTRFLGDLYQDLSEAARKKYALLQTPEFVEEFILDRTLGPAIDEFGYQAVRVIDPTCGSGHFLLGAFSRLFELYVRNEPGVNAPELARRALSQVSGIDLNPFAVAIARFRLLVATLKVSGIERLQDAPAYEFKLAVGDSLLHGSRAISGVVGDTGAVTRNLYDDQLHHHYKTEDADKLRRILQPTHYHAVVGNPPYITVKDAALNKAYRERFGSCYMKYSLAAPFMERFFDLAIKGSDRDSAGYIGLITANSFMKREFGKKLIERYIPRWDLTQIIDTSGAYIPGHGTPTVVLFGRHREPISKTIRTVMGIKGEPSTPKNPANGKVWQSIVSMVDDGGAQNEFVSVVDTKRASFHKHPWSVGGGGAAELKEFIDEQGKEKLEDILGEKKSQKKIGPASFAGTDEAFFSDRFSLTRLGYPDNLIKDVVYGESVRDWSIDVTTSAFVPYDSNFNLIALDKDSKWAKSLWHSKTEILSAVSFGGKTRRDLDDPWWSWYRWIASKYKKALIITFASVATHNQFTLHKGNKVFTQSAPVVVLPNIYDRSYFCSLLGLLNSSVAGFWMKQVFHCKGSTVDDKGARQTTVAFENFYDFDGTKLKQFPLPKEKPFQLTVRIDELADKLQSLQPSFLAENETPERDAWQAAKREAEQVREQMIFLQEELDWQCYKFYNLTAEDFLLKDHENKRLQLGERAFEVVMARKMATGELQTTWFDRHASTPIIEIPTHWPEEYRHLVERRIEAIAQNVKIRLIEQPEYKRRWNTEPWDSQAERALREWLLSRLEDPRYWAKVELTTSDRLADRVRSDSEFMQVAEMYRGRSDFDVSLLVAELVKSESVPFLPVLRYKTSGLRNRQVWEQVWEMQRREDAIDARTKLPAADPQRLTETEAKRFKAEQVGDIPVPPKYKSADFIEQTFWRLRGKLDVPKERFVSYPRCERDADPSLVIAWAGWNHLQQSQALASYYQKMKTDEGWGPTRLVPLLTGLVELLPWLMQWHNDVDPAYGIGMGDFFKGFVDEEARALGLTLNRVREWSPE